MRRTTALLIGSGLLALTSTLTGCGSSGSADPTDPAPPRPSPTARASGNTSTPTPGSTTGSTSAPTPPVMPEAAKAHTTAGAKAFVKHFWNVVDYAQATGDTGAVTALSLVGCKGCQGGVHSIDGVYTSGGSIRGGQTTTSHYSVEWIRSGKLQLAYVIVDLTFGPQTVDMPGTAHDKVSTGSRSTDRLELLAQAHGWKVAQLGVLS